MQIALTIYRAVLPLHIIAVMAAYRLPLAYPSLLPHLREHHPRAMPGVLDVQLRLNKRAAGPASAFIFLFGAYMATKNHLWQEAWLDLALVLFATISLIGAAYIIPVSRRMAQLASADVAASAPTNKVMWGAEYERVYGRYLKVEIAHGLLVLVVITLMTAKRFA
ncbi:MAG: putative integral rane protein [Actinomycetota bacterium]